MSASHSPQTRGISPCDLPLTLADHQIRILHDMAEHNHWGIFAEAGTGKTMIALTWIYNALISGRIDDALVICPFSIIASWRLAIDKMSLFGYSEDEIDIVRDAVTLISYSSVWVRNKNFKRKKGETKYLIRPTVKKKWGVIFCDESHRLGDPTSAQTKTVLNMSRLSDNRYIMTGTPDNQRYTKLFGQLKFLEPSLFGEYRDFDRRYVLTKDYFGNPVRYDVEALESLKRSHGSVARLRECYDMPSETETDIPVPFTAEGMRIYEDMLAMRGEGLGIKFQTAGVSSMKAKQSCSGFVYDDDHNPHRFKCGKAEAMMELIEGRTSKVVVFCQYTPSVDIVCDSLKRAGIEHRRFDSQEKEPIWMDFQKDSNIRVIVVQYQRSEGLDLFSADTMIFFEPTPIAHTLEQAKARIMRKGQTKQCSYYYLFTPDSLEEKSMRSVRRGVDVSRRMLDDWAEEERQKWALKRKTHKGYADTTPVS